MTSILYPYPTVGDAFAALRVTRLLVDGKAKPRLVNSDECTISLHEEKQTWRAELGLEVACEADALEAFEREHGPVAVTVTANCAPTNHRHAVRLERSRVKPPLWTGEIEIDRDNASERTYLTAALTAEVRGVANRPVAATPRWTVYADEPQSLHFQGTLRVSWLDFEALDAPPLARDFPRSTHVVDFDGNTPRLLLNSRFDGLHALLGDRKGRQGVDRALHDFQRMSIARATWLALIAEALAGVQGDPNDPTDVPDWPASEWKTEVLKHVLPLVAPDKGEAELLALAAGDWRGEGAGQFFARAEAVIGERLGANGSVRRYVQTYEREGVK